MFEQFKNINLKDISSVKVAFESLDLLPSLICAIACIVIAFFAYKIFKLSITVSVSCGFGILGAWLTPMVLKGITLPAGLSLTPIMTFALAIIGALLAMWLYKVAIFAVGAGLGYFGGVIAAKYLGAAGAGVAFFDGTAGQIIVSVVCALIIGVVLLICYKYIYIIITSIGAVALAAMIIALEVYPDYANYALIAGAVIGLIPMFYQFKSADEI